jgi:hypothetical protein
VVARARARVDAVVAAVIGFAIVGFVLRVAVLPRPIGVIDRLFVPDDTYYTVEVVKGLAQFPPFPDDALGEIRWPASTASADE